MKSAEFRDMLGLLADSWRNRDYAMAATFFANDVRYADPTRYHFETRTDLRAFFQADDGMPQNTMWRTVVFDETQQIGAAEYTYDGTHRYHGTVLIRVGGGQITHWREYQHVDPRTYEEFVAETAFPG